MKGIRSLSTLTALLTALALAQLRAQTPADTLTVPPARRWQPRFERWAPAAIGAGALTAGVLSVHSNPTHAAPAVEQHKTPVADVVQYAPLAFPWVMKACGAETRSGWGRMAVSQGLGAGLMAGVTYGLKHAVDEQRPDASDRRSFPSGHAAWAFFGATATAIELADQSPWYAIGAYAVATGVAVERVVDQRHFPVDVVAGAGIGITAAEIGYYLGDIIFGHRGLGRRSCLDDLCESANLSYLSIASELRWPVGSVNLGGGVEVVRLPSLTAGVKGGMALGDHWGVTAFAGLQSTPVDVRTPAGTTHVAALNAAGFAVGPYYQLQLSPRLLFNTEATLGYYANLRLKSDNYAVAAGRGSVTGRLSAGIVFNFTRALAVKASVGYELQGATFEVWPSTAYLVDTHQRHSGVAGYIVAGLSTRINF